ncbi:peroxisomal hydratase-dehydrogenase-epimerase-like [Agrilus planipennis]|uniref:Peroxisomal hydratase-dehydrogenase-epimerase-like n=1 Tax=Agrilus planipennis TaxID=224129 RepID=A0A7F5R8H5_AGRPL|nr:peroxisomal hydratase-dehydrogenase-epimerase-like [Agrilus planipennis]
MPFIKGKVALITGGASGIGLVTAKEMLRNGLKAAVLADINPKFGQKAIQEITKEFGANKVIFKQTDVANKSNAAVLADINPKFGQKAIQEITKEFGANKVIFKQTDVANKSNVKEAFEETIKNFEQLDIVINNAGIMNDKIWEQEIDINCKGVVYGTLLALEEYIPKFKSSKEGIVVNVASVAGLDPFELTPIYSATKSFVVQFSRGIASDFNYKRTKVKVITICPGSTDTPLSYLKGKLLNPIYEEMLEDYDYSRQNPEFLAEEIVSAIEKGKNGTTWIIEECPATKIYFRDRLELQKLSKFFCVQEKSYLLMFSVKGKVVLVTGGASGIGLKTIKELFKNGLKGAGIADLNPDLGKKAVAEIEKEFGSGKVIFKKTDVTNKASLKDAFEATVEHFKQLDIVINNAGIMNDAIWEKEIDINCKGLVYGTLFALEEYLPKYKKGEEGVIVNISSCAGIDPLDTFPAYCGTKAFVLSFSRSIGNETHYKRTNVKVVTVCPGPTDTPLLQLEGKIINPDLSDHLHGLLQNTVMQSTEDLAKGIVSAIVKGKNGSVWLIENAPPTELHFSDRFELQRK